jgi:hypothetical protein
MGSLITFPLTPKKPDSTTFRFSGGNIIWCGVPIEERQAVALRETYSTECRAAYQAGDHPSAVRAAKLWLQLTRGLDALRDWQGAVQ